MMHIAILQHVAHEGPAALANWAAAGGHDTTTYPLYADPALPAHDDFDCLVVLGGGMSVDDGDVYPWLEPERALIRAALAARRPVIGICLGAQQMARALGAAVFPNGEREVGFWHIRRVDDALPLPATQTVCHWHGDTFSLPEGAVLLAESDACRNQVFVTGDGLGLGLQCHLEATPQWVDACCTHDAGYLIPGRWMQDAARLRAERTAYPQMHAALFTLLDAFLGGPARTASNINAASTPYRASLMTLGTPGAPGATRMMLLGSGELGKEVAIEAQRFGIEVIAVDRYAGAPAMQVAHRSHVVNMLDGDALSALVAREHPALIVPEIEAIATATLLELERQGQRVIPTARAVHLTMNREGIRRLAAEELGLPTSPFRFADDEAGYLEAVAEIGLPCVIKPVMSSSGKGQSLVRQSEKVSSAWNHSQQGGRAGSGRVIVEGFIAFDYEITLLTLRHGDHTSFCAPIGHLQVDGDYRESWQPHPMTETALQRAQQIARAVTDNLGGHGIFGVELFVRGDEVWFSEVSPRPHDTGMVTLISQELSEFALHARAILGLPVPEIRSLGPSASVALLAEGHSSDIRFEGVERALQEPDTGLRLFGKPEVSGRRRVGVALARGDTLEQARKKARQVAAAVRIVL